MSLWISIAALVINIILLIASIRLNRKADKLHAESDARYKAYMEKIRKHREESIANLRSGL